MSLDVLCTGLTADPEGTGEFLDRGDAKAMFDQMKLSLNNPEQAVIASLFGFDKLLSFVDQINGYNIGHPKGDPLRITGFRVYKCLDLGRAYYDRHDVFLMPVTANGKDLYKGFDRKTKIMDPKDLILGDGRPCPNLCSGTSYQFD